MSTSADTTRFPVDRNGMADILREYNIDPDSIDLPRPQYSEGGERWTATQVQAVIRRATGNRVALSKGPITYR